MYAAILIATAATVSARHGATWGVADRLRRRLARRARHARARPGRGHPCVHGLYTAERRRWSWHIGPLLNPNNLAGYLNLGALCGLGLAARGPPHRPPAGSSGSGSPSSWAWEVIVGLARRRDRRCPVGCGGALLLTRFREGGRSRTRSMSTVMLSPSSVGPAARSSAILGGTSRNVGSSSSTRTSLQAGDDPLGQAARPRPPLLRRRAGRVREASSLPTASRRGGTGVYTHAGELRGPVGRGVGAPVGLGALAAWRSGRSPRAGLGAHRSAPPRARGAASVAVLLLQNLVDLALEVPRRGHRRGDRPRLALGDTRRARTREILRRLGPFTPPGRARSPSRWPRSGPCWGDRRDRRHARPRLRPPGGARGARRRPHRQARPAQVRSLLHQPCRGTRPRPTSRRSARRWPTRAHAGSAIPWLQRSLERAQVNGRAHLLLAEVLALRGARRQALLELRLALEDDPALLSVTTVLAMRWAKGFDDLLAVVPEGSTGAGRSPTWAP